MPDLPRALTDSIKRLFAAWHTAIGHGTPHDSAGGAHNILSASHIDTHPSDVPADLELLTYIATASRFEARPASDPGTHGAGGVHAASHAEGAADTLVGQ